MPRIRGESEPDRVVVTEGRGAHALRVGRYRLVLRDAGYRHVHEKGRRSERPIELYDLQTDPGERVDIHEREPEVVQRLMELDRARRAAPAAGAPVRGADRPVLHLRFASAGQRKHLAGWVALARGAPGALAVVPIGLGPEAAVLREGRVVVDAQTSADAVVGIDLSADPAADLEWHFTLDDAPIAADRVFAGAYGLVAPALAAGLRGDTARRAAAADALPWIDAERELGLFIARDVAAQELELTPRDAAKEEAMDLMRAWGYVRSR
jgi:hypothetical protein